MAVVSGYQESPRAKDLFTAIYSSEMCQDYFQKKRIARVKRILKSSYNTQSTNSFLIFDPLLIFIMEFA